MSNEKADKYTMYMNGDGVITIQRAPYIEDGWYVEIRDTVIELYEIPQFGGSEPQFIDRFDTIYDAIKKGESLT